MTDCTWPKCECPERDTCRKAKPADYAEFLARLADLAERFGKCRDQQTCNDAAAAIRSLIGERDEARADANKCRATYDPMASIHERARAEAAEARHEVTRANRDALLAKLFEYEKSAAFYADGKNWRMNGPLDPNSSNFTGGPFREKWEQTVSAALARKGEG